VVTYTPLGLRAEKLITSEDGGISVPVTLRGQKIGGISIARKDAAPWSQPDQELIAEVATQAGLAIENIRLLDEATTRAQQERLVGGLAFRFSQALDIDSLLQTAARELGQIPGVEEATVLITQPEDEAVNRGLSAKNSLRRNGS
jgi:GAF domain-containing protein